MPELTLDELRNAITSELEADEYDMFDLGDPWEDPDEAEYSPEYDFDEVGFNPYMGCYDWDC